MPWIPVITCLTPLAAHFSNPKERHAMCSQLVFVLKINIKIKRAFPLCGHHEVSDIEGSQSNVAINAGLPHAMDPCDNLSDTSSCRFLKPQGTTCHVFTACIRTENQNQNQASFSPFGHHEVTREESHKQMACRIVNVQTASTCFVFSSYLL